MPSGVTDRGVPAWAWVAALVVVVVLGFASAMVIAGLTVHDQELTDARTAVAASANQSAAALAADLAETTESGLRFVDDLGLHDATRDPAACSDALATLAGVATGIQILVVDARLEPVCALDGEASLPDDLRPVARRAVRTGEPSTQLDGETAVMVLPLGSPPSGVLLGRTTAADLLSGVDPNRSVAAAPSTALGDLSYVLVDERSGVIALTNEVGEDASPAPGSVAAFLEASGGTWRGLDGVERIYRSAPVGGTAMRIFVGTDSAAVRARAREVVTRLVVPAVLALVAVGVLAALLGAWLLRPIRRMTVAVDRSGARRDPERVPRSGPRELRRLAEAYNAMVDDRVEHERRLEEQALHDGLTGLANRTLLIDRLDQALRRAQRTSRRVATLFCDLDRFKVINDSMGHEAGDATLRAVAERIVGAVRPADTVARFGGDEFVVVCEEIADEAEAVEIARRIAAALEPPITVGNEQVRTTVSVGVSLAGPESTPSEALRDADTAMYQVKTRAGAGVEVFSTRLRARAEERWQIERDLGQALARHEMELWYQPQVDVRTGAVVGAEGLLRWRHPTWGVVAPHRFLPVAEEIGAIHELGRFVVADAIERLARWSEQGRSLRVAVNASARELCPAFVEHVAATLRAWSVDPSRLCIELTEQAIIDSEPDVLDLVREIRSLGVRIALDDFGTGYSSLASLAKLPIDVLKLDRSLVVDLVADERSHAVAISVGQLADALSLETVAEGVETEAQRDALALAGFTVMQGYLFGRPQLAGRATVPFATVSAST